MIRQGWELYKVVEKYDDWKDKIITDEMEIKDVKKAIKKFYYALRNTKPNKDYEMYNIDKKLYIRHLKEVDNSFREKRYKRVCHEILDCLVHGNLCKESYYTLLCVIEYWLIRDWGYCHDNGLFLYTF